MVPATYYQILIAVISLHKCECFPVATYAFTKAACKGNVFECHGREGIKPLHRLKRNIDVTTCDKSMGVTVIGGNESTVAFFPDSSVSDIIDDLSNEAKGVSMEIWFRPASSDGKKHSILTIGSKNMTSGLGLSICDQEGFDFQISQRDAGLEITFRTSDPFIEPCQVTRLTELPHLEYDKLTHLVVSLGNHHQQVFLNAHPSAVLRQHFSDDLQHWSKGYFIHVAGYAREQSLWSGTLYLIKFLSGILSRNETKSLISDGLPPSAPYAIPSEAIVNEDAEDVAGSHSVEWYAAEAPIDDTSRIRLRYWSINKDVQHLQEILNLEPKRVLQSPIFYVKAVPVKGQLLQENGSPLRANDLVPSGLIQVHSVIGELVYIPPFNMHSDSTNTVSGFASFSFCVSEVLIFDSLKCEAAVFTIHVTPVNDPPLASAVDHVSLMEGNVTLNLPKILLTGTDVDVDDSIRFIEISRPPAYGDLILSVSTFRTDRLLHGIPLRDLDYIVPSHDPVFVNYIWRPDGRGPVVTGNGAQDTFHFRVQDSKGLWSAEERVEIMIQSALGASFASVVDFIEDSKEDGNVTWHVFDKSGYMRQLGVLLDSIPALKYGNLVHVKTKEHLVTGSLLYGTPSKFASDDFSLTFYPSAEICTGYQEFDEGVAQAQVKFRVVAFAPGRNDSIISVSEAFVQDIRVLCSDRKVVLTVPVEQLKLKENSLHRAGSGYYRNCTTESCHGKRNSWMAVIHGINVTGTTKQSRSVLVTVLPGKGYLTFNSESWSKVKKITGRRAVASGNVTFLALEDDLNNIFSDLLFESNTLGSDRIEFHLTYPRSKGTGECQVLHSFIEVYVEADQEKYSAKDIFGHFVPWQILFCLLGYPCAYYAFVRLEVIAEGSAEIDHADESLDRALWIRHKTEDGETYYENTETGEVTWQGPLDGDKDEIVGET